MAGALVRSVILDGASQLIRSLGRRPAAIARKAGLPAKALEDPDLAVSGRAVMRFFDLAAVTCDTRTFGLQMSLGKRLAPVIGPLWLLLRNARSVRQLCEDLARHYDLYSSAALMNFDAIEGGGLLGWSAATGQAQSEVQIAEYALGVLLNEVRSHAPQDWTPAVVWFRHAAPRDLRLHRRVFGSRLRFEADRNAIQIDDALLDRSMRGSTTRDRALLLNLLKLDEPVPATATIHWQVEGIVRGLLPFSACGIQDVSTAMGLPARTLQARLKVSGHSFRSIKESVRRDLAHKYLQHSGMSATQVAGLLGYEELASLSRSFRRWNGQTIRSSRTRAGKPEER